MASAAVEMLTLSACRKMMAYNADLGVDYVTENENKVNGTDRKRLLLDAEEDQGTGQVKKRRKQSKPVRIASSESLSDEENFVDNGITENGKIDVKVSNDGALFCKNNVVNNLNMVPTNSCIDEYDTKVENGMNDNYSQRCNQENAFNGNESSLLPINLSNSKCSTNGVQTEYIATQYTTDANQNVNPEQTLRINDISSQPFQERNFDVTRFERDSLFNQTASSPLSFSLMKPTHNVGTQNNPHIQVRVSASPVRIFNPEAFCDLCNKEFCNKYFLKTHKANKHGIYSENVGSNLIDTLPSLPFINYFSNISDVLPANSQIPRTVMRKQLVSASLNHPNAVYPQKNAASNGNIRAFCNICQREFCNKYFVRRHKVKIHGISDPSFPDTPPGDSQDPKYHNINDPKFCSGNHEKNEDHEILHSNFPERQCTPLLPSDDIDKSDNKSCENKTQSPLNEQQASLRQCRETDSDGCISPSMLRDSSPLQTPMKHDEVSKDIDPGEKLRRIGISNSEAFCEICCKEYCNKYFLRTHKLKSHGISHPDWDKREDRLNIFENSMSNVNNQNMPLNLIIGYQNLDKTENGSSDMTTGAVFCHICGQKFKDMFLLKMHASYSRCQEYAKQLINENSNSVSNEKVFKPKETVKAEPNAETANKANTHEEKCFNVDFQNMNSVILQCEICHKGFDSIALEAHIESEHGHLLEEVNTLVEENSNSQIFHKDDKYDCAMCQRQFSSGSSLNQHIIECHGTTAEQVTNNLMNVKTVKELEETAKSNQMQSMLNANEVQATPTSSFCEICKKELCNKYFMKTHMQRMHGISIDNGAHIGGVVCDICNKELCSKYFLRVHKQNSHGIVDEVLGLDISRNQSPSTDPSLRPSEQTDLNNRYFSHFTEVCTICSRRFRSMKWLKAHLLNDHGDEGKEKWKEFQSHYELKQFDRFPQDNQKTYDTTNAAPSQANTSVSNSILNRNFNDNFSQKFDSTVGSAKVNEDNVKSSNVFTTIFNGKNTNTKQYQCTYCPFTTSILAFLFVHERSHINGSSTMAEQNKMFHCKFCPLKFESEKSYEKHCISHTLSDASSSTSNGISMIQNDKSKTILLSSMKNSDMVESDNSTIDNGIDKSTPYQFQMGAKYFKAKEPKVEDSVAKKHEDYEESKHEFRHGEADFIVTYNGALPDHPRKDCVPDDKTRRDAEVDDEVNVAMHTVKESLELIANKTDFPVSYSLPQNQKQIIMQPFILEDSGAQASNNAQKAGFKSSFLSSIVFLPVTERLTNPMTVSLKLTPML